MRFFGGLSIEDTARIAAPYVKLGDALARNGTREEAEQAYRRAIEILAPLRNGSTPTFGAAYLLADAYFGLGNLSGTNRQESTS